jgi:hypothetical protein
MKVRKSFIRGLLYACGALALQGVAKAETIITVPFKMDGSAASIREAMKTQPRGVVVYDNPRGIEGDVYFVDGEIGDEFTLGVGLRVINQIQFEYFAALNPFESTQRGVFRIYANNGQVAGEGKPKKPGDLLFESESFSLRKSYNMVTVNDLKVILPHDTNSVTWAVEFYGLSSIGKAGLLLNDLPNTGSSGKTFWVNGGTKETPDWQLQQHTIGRGNFSVRAAAQTMPVELAVNQDVYVQEDSIKVMFRNGPGYPKDWVGVYRADIIPGSTSSSDWSYVNGSKTPGEVEITGTLVFDSGLLPGDYVVYFFENDSFDQLAQFPFEVLDTTSPVITLQGQGNIRINVGEEYQDAGARASDNLDGDITKAIEANGAVDSSKPGVYTITYNVKDQAGNASYEAVRTVEVANPNPPVISIVRNINSEVIISFKGKLELATTIKGPWENVSEKSPLIINPNKEILFYRSVK